MAVLTHAAAVDRRGRQTLSVLEELGATPRIVFAPEHGFDADAQAEEAVASRGAAESGEAVPFVSLYGSSREATASSA